MDLAAWTYSRRDGLVLVLSCWFSETSSGSFPLPSARCTRNASGLLYPQSRQSASVGVLAANERGITATGSESAKATLPIFRISSPDFV